MKTLLVALLFFSTTSFAATKEYFLSVEHKNINLSGKKEVNFAMTINGSIPGPTLEFTEGDEAVIHVANHTHMDTTIHWHGVLVPVEMDGVSPLSFQPIHPGETFTYRFPIRQNGTYWYHSHTMLQEQQGVLGAIVIHPKKELHHYDHEAVISLMDWIDEEPHHVLSNLRKDGDYYLWKKHSLQSWWGAIQNHALKNYANNQWIRMGGMDLSDIAYDAFLINGKKFSSLPARKGQTWRLRIINAGASSFFYLSLAGLDFTVIAADGKDIKPVRANELLLGIAETYDILFTLPENNSYELRATAQDITGYSSLFIGGGEKIIEAPTKIKPNPYQMDHSTHAAMPAGMDHSKMDHSMMHHDHSASVGTLNYSQLRSLEKTNFSAEHPRKGFRLEMDGDMERYIWYFNNKMLFEDSRITVREGDLVRFVLVNNSMMHHPMHLHGHFFRVLNEQGDYSPLKHTVDIPPMQTQTIEFLASEPGEWFFHCHNLYHMKNGMARVVSYEGYKRPAELAEIEKQSGLMMDSDWYYYGTAYAFTNRSNLYLRASNARWQIDSTSELPEYKSREAESNLLLHRWIGKFAHPFVGGQYYRKNMVGVLGLSYTLPMFFTVNTFVDHKGKFAAGYSYDTNLSSRLRLEADGRFFWKHPYENRIAILYAINWHWAAGVHFTEDGFGVGVKAKF